MPSAQQQQQQQAQQSTASPRPPASHPTGAAGGGTMNGHHAAQQQRTSTEQQPAAAASSELERTLERLLQSLLELGICASDVQEVALEKAQNGPAQGYPGGLVGRKTSQTVELMSQLHNLKDSLPDAYVPLDVIRLVDAGRNPHAHTREFVERTAGENMYTNGMVQAISGYRERLVEQLGVAFPDLNPSSCPSTSNGGGGSSHTTALAPATEGAAHENGDVQMRDEVANGPSS